MTKQNNLFEKLKTNNVLGMSSNYFLEEDIKEYVQKIYLNIFLLIKDIEDRKLLLEKVNELTGESFVL